MTRDERLLREQFRSLTDRAQKAAEALTYTWKRIGDVEALLQLAATAEGKERLDSLTSRFARLADVLTQQVFRLADQLDYLEEGSFIDRLNRAEKRGWIESSDDWRRIRELRNQISHQYSDEKWRSIVQEVFRYVPVLLECVARIPDVRDAKK